MSEEETRLLRFLAASVESIRDRMVTKEELARVATKEDLARMATKEDLARMAAKEDLVALREEVAAGFVAVRGDLERVHLRIDSVDRTLTTRLDGMDNQLSRLRSVVYLLGKDQPEVLRLLGGAPT